MAHPWIAPALAALAAALAPSGDDSLPEGALVRLGSWRLRHRDPVTALDFGPSGVLSSGVEGGLRVWSAEDGAPLFARDLEPGVGVSSAAFLGEGRAAFLRGDGGLVRWSFADPGAAAGAPAPEQGSRLAVSPDGRRGCITGADESLRLVDLDSGAVQHSVAAEKLLPDAAAFSPDGARVAVACNNRNKLQKRRGTEGEPSAALLLIRAETGEVERRIESPTHTLGCVAFTPDGAEVVAADDQGALRVWRVADGNLRLTAPPAVESPARGLAVGADGSFAAVARDDGAVALVGLAKGEQRARVAVARTPLSGVALSPDGKTLAACAGFELFLFDLPGLTPRAPSFRHAGPIAALAWTPDGERLVTGSYDRTLRLWSAGDGRGVQSADANAGFVFGVAAGKDLLVAGGQDGHVRLFAPDGAPRADIAAHEGACTDVALSPDGSLLASAGADRALRLIDPKSGEVLRSAGDLPGLQFRVAWSPDGKRVAVGSADVRLVDAATGTVATVVPRLPAPLTALAFAPDGKTIAAGLADRSIMLLDPAGAPPQFLHGHRGRVTALAFSPDGALLASASANETEARLWSARERKQLKLLGGFQREVMSLAFDPRGERLAAGSMDGTGLVWKVE